MADILQEVLKQLPDKTKISNACFEGANIILYTKDADFFLNSNGTIKKIVLEIKKRVELRPDPAICLTIEETKLAITQILPKEAGVSNILFDPKRSLVIIEAQKPGLAIGKQGELLKEIKRKTLWVPIIQRSPAIKSQIIENIRSVLYENNDYRKKFLNKIGKRIYDDWTNQKQKNWIRISFLGAGREVGRSCLLLQTSESQILLDCGVNVAADESKAYPHLDAPEFNIEELDAVILAHSHVDHCGFVPFLYKMGYKGPVYFTEPTRDVSSLICLDMIGIYEKEGKKPIYSSTDVKNMVKHGITLNYEEVTDITPDIRMTFYNAGHVLGSCLVHLHIGNGLHNLLYTSDFNYELSNLLSMANTKFPRLETVIMESTYGEKGKEPMTRKEAEDYLKEIITNTVKRGGKILMPVLGSGRSQEVMVIIEALIRGGKLQKLPVYIQGMVWDMTAIHTAYPDFFNAKIKKAIFHKDLNPFLSDIFIKVGSKKEMTEVIEQQGPCIIIATSGMMTGGSSVEYFKELAEDKRHSLILTSYQGLGSLGRRLQDGEREIIFPRGNKQEIINTKLDVHFIHGFTGHSTREQLINFVHNLDPKPRRIIFIHGESNSCLDIASTVHKLNRIETNTPKNLEVIRLR